MQTARLKRKIEKLRLELEKVIQENRSDDIFIDSRIYKLSTNIDDLINIYIKGKTTKGSGPLTVVNNNVNKNKKE